MRAPAISFDGTGIAAIAGVVLLAGVGVWAYQKRQAIADALNPTKDTNIASRTASAAASALAGRDESVGTGFYELTQSPWFNPFGWFARKATGKPSADDIDWSAPVSAPKASPSSGDLANFYGI